MPLKDSASYLNNGDAGPASAGRRSRLLGPNGLRGDGAVGPFDGEPLPEWSGPVLLKGQPPAATDQANLFRQFNSASPAGRAEFLTAPAESRASEPLGQSAANSGGPVGPPAPKRHILSILNGTQAEDHLFDMDGSPQAVGHRRRRPDQGNEVGWQNKAEFDAAGQQTPQQKLMALIDSTNNVSGPLDAGELLRRHLNDQAVATHQAASLDNEKRKTDLLGKQIDRRDDPTYRRDDMIADLMKSDPRITPAQAAVRAEEIMSASRRPQAGGQPGQAAGPPTQTSEALRLRESLGPDVYDAIEGGMSALDERGKPKIGIQGIADKLWAEDQARAAKGQPGYAKSRSADLMKLLNKYWTGDQMQSALGSNPNMPMMAGGTLAAGAGLATTVPWYLGGPLAVPLGLLAAGGSLAAAPDLGEKFRSFGGRFNEQDKARAAMRDLMRNYQPQ